MQEEFKDDKMKRLMGDSEQQGIDKKTIRCEGIHLTGSGNTK